MRRRSSLLTFKRLGGRMKKSVAFVMVLFFMCCGCITTTETRGSNNLDAVSSIIKGVSTKADVVNIFGPPDQEITSDNGTQVCTWVSVKEKHDILWEALTTRGVDSTDQMRKNSLVGREVRQVSITFSPDGVVVSINTSKTGKI